MCSVETAVYLCYGICVVLMCISFDYMKMQRSQETKSTDFVTKFRSEKERKRVLGQIYQDARHIMLPNSMETKSTVFVTKFRSEKERKQVLDQLYQVAHDHGGDSFSQLNSFLPVSSLNTIETSTSSNFMSSEYGYNHKSGHSSKRRSRIPPKTNFMRPASTDTTSTSWNFSTSPSSKKGNCTHTHGASVFATSSVKDLSYYEQLLTILPTRMTRSIAMNDETPITSDKFPSHSGYEGPHYEIQFFPSDAADSKFVSISINVANSYLRTIARSRVRGRLTVEIPAMEINVTISYASQTTASESIEIKSVMTVTKKTEIDCESSCLWTAEVASFPQIVSHAQLKLPQSESIIIIKVKMRVLQD